jgi:GNAT superfamily N-acetyltransferase
MLMADIPGAVALQRACFPEPFPEELLWAPDHLERHLEIFPEGQFVAIADGQVVASASNTRISEPRYEAHESWDATVGGPFLQTFDPAGATLYGLDISVHPNYRSQGIGRLLYQARFDLVRILGLARYATACRIPDFHLFPGNLDDYVKAVTTGNRTDRTLTPLLRYGLKLVTGLENYMDDEESRNCAALLEWVP